MRKAMSSQEERWVFAAHKFLSYDEYWYEDVSRERAVGLIMKYAGGSLDPKMVTERVNGLYDYHSGV